MVNGNDLFNNFHTYGYEWTPGRVIFYLDGEPYRVMESSLIDDTPLRLWINMGFAGSTITDATFPGNLYVDRVRIYNLRRDCISGNSNEEILNNSDLINFDYMVKNTIKISGKSSSISVPQNEQVTFRATDNITIEGDFTVPLGSELCILPTTCY